MWRLFSTLSFFSLIMVFPCKYHEALLALSLYTESAGKPVELKEELFVAYWIEVCSALSLFYSSRWKKQTQLRPDDSVVNIRKQLTERQWKVWLEKSRLLNQEERTSSLHVHGAM